MWMQAQTVANFYLAYEQNLTIVPIINKVRASRKVKKTMNFYEHGHSEITPTVSRILYDFLEKYRGRDKEKNAKQLVSATKPRHLNC